MHSDGDCHVKLGPLDFEFTKWLAVIVMVHYGRREHTRMLKTFERRSDMIPWPGLVPNRVFYIFQAAPP